MSDDKIVLPPKELKLIKADPWKEMAIEKQFRPLVPEETPWELPATLAYLEQESGEYEDPEGRLADAEKYLLARLHQGRYLLALINILWSGPEETMPSDAMSRTLSPPGVLIQELGAQFAPR